MAETKIEREQREAEEERKANETPYDKGQTVDATDGSAPPIRDLCWITLADKGLEERVVVARWNGEAWDGEENGKQYGPLEVVGYQKLTAKPPAAASFSYAQAKDEGAKK